MGLAWPVQTGLPLLFWLGGRLVALDVGNQKTHEMMAGTGGCHQLGVCVSSEAGAFSVSCPLRGVFMETEARCKVRQVWVMEFFWGEDGGSKCGLCLASRQGGGGAVALPLGSVGGAGVIVMLVLTAKGKGNHARQESWKECTELGVSHGRCG